MTFTTEYEFVVPIKPTRWGRIYLYKCDAADPMIKPWILMWDKYLSTYISVVDPDGTIWPCERLDHINYDYLGLELKKLYLDSNKRPIQVYDDLPEVDCLAWLAAIKETIAEINI